MYYDEKLKFIIKYIIIERIHKIHQPFTVQTNNFFLASKYLCLDDINHLIHYKIVSKKEIPKQHRIFYLFDIFIEYWNKKKKKILTKKIVILKLSSLFDRSLEYLKKNTHKIYLIYIFLFDCDQDQFWCLIMYNINKMST